MVVMVASFLYLCICLHCSLRGIDVCALFIKLEKEKKERFHSLTTRNDFLGIINRR